MTPALLCRMLLLVPKMGSECLVLAAEMVRAFGMNPNAAHYTPHTTKLLGGILVSVRPSVRLFVRPASRVHCVAPTDLIGSISYLYILSSNFRRCVACKVSCKILKFVKKFFCKICNFDFVLFWLGIWCEPPVWGTMGRWGVSQNAGVLVVLVLYQF